MEVSLNVSSKEGHATSCVPIRKHGRQEGTGTGTKWALPALSDPGRRLRSSSSMAAASCVSKSAGEFGSLARFPVRLCCFRNSLFRSHSDLPKKRN